MVLREIELECFPADVPDHILVDVTDLEIGDATRVEALHFDKSKAELLSDPALVVLTVVPPHVEKEPEEVALEEAEVLEGEEAEEPEVIKKGKEEEEPAQEEGE